MKHNRTEQIHAYATQHAKRTAKMMESLWGKPKKQPTNIIPNDVPNDAAYNPEQVADD